MEQLYYVVINSTPLTFIGLRGSSTTDLRRARQFTESDAAATAERQPGLAMPIKVASTNRDESHPEMVPGKRLSKLPYEPSFEPLPGSQGPPGPTPAAIEGLKSRGMLLEELVPVSRPARKSQAAIMAAHHPSHGAVRAGKRDPPSRCACGLHPSPLESAVNHGLALLQSVLESFPPPGITKTDISGFMVKNRAELSRMLISLAGADKTPAVCHRGQQDLAVPIEALRKALTRRPPNILVARFGAAPPAEEILNLSKQLDEVVRQTRSDDWRGFRPRAQILKGALHGLLRNVADVEYIFEVILQQAEY